MRVRNVLLPALAVVATSAGATFAPATPPTPRPSPAARATPAPPPTLEGVVRGPDGKPIEKALVVARPQGPAPGETVAARTDAQGRFRLDLRSRAKHRVRAEAAGLAGRTIVDVAPGTPLTLDLARGGTIEGVVRDGETGQPAAGIRIETRDGDALPVATDPGVGRIESTSDREGRFTLSGLGTGRHNITARGRGHGYASRNGVAVGARVDMLLEPASTLSGIVSGPDGRPVAGAVVTPLAIRSPRAPRAERTDALGRFELAGLTAGLYDVAVRAPGLAPGAVTDVVVDGRDDLRVDVKLQPGARVTGRLVGSNDKPIAGAVSIGELDGHPAPYVLADLLRAEAGADGRFAIDAVPAGGHALGATARGLAPRRVEVEVSATQRAVDLGDVRMESGLVIRGRVRNASGDPVADAHVYGRAVRSVTGLSVEAQTERDGTFAIGGVEDLTYRMSATAPGYGTVRADAEPGTEVELVLDTAGSIAGRVHDERGQPVETFTVIARPAAEDGPFAYDQFTAADGRFTLEDVSPGAYAITVRAAEHAPASASAKVVGGRSADVGALKLGPGGSIRGVVVDAGGAFVGAAKITLTHLERNVTTITFDDEPEIVSDRSGAFEAKGLEAGSYEISASHPGYARSVPVATAVEVGQAPPEVRLLLTEGGRIEGTYRRRDGEPVPGAFVVATPNPLGSWQGSALVPVQPDGSFTIEHVRAGLVRVTTMTSAGRGSYRSAQVRETSVRDGETARLDVVNREILLSGRVTRASGTVSALRLEADTGGSTSFGGRGQTVPYAARGPERLAAVTREDGTFEMMVDEPGTIRLTVWSPDRRFRFPVRTVAVPDADAHSVELSFDGVPVTGIVIDRDTEAPIPYAHVTANALPSLGQSSATVDAGPDGRFALELAPGDYRFLGQADDHSFDSVKVGVGPAGVTDVRVSLARALRISGRALDPSGRPVGSAQLLAAAYASDSMRSGETLADGSFEIRGLKDVDHRVTAWSDAGFFAIRPAVGAGTTNLLLQMQPAARVTVEVVGANDEPVAGLSPNVGSIDGDPNMGGLGRCGSPTDAQGRTELLAPAGRIVISASKGQLAGYTSIDVAPGERASARIALRPPPPRQGAAGPSRR